MSKQTPTSSVRMTGRPIHLDSLIDLPLRPYQGMGADVAGGRTDIMGGAPSPMTSPVPMSGPDGYRKGKLRIIAEPLEDYANQ
jgi:hypothetical protein